MVYLAEAIFPERRDLLYSRAAGAMRRCTSIVAEMAGRSITDTRLGILAGWRLQVWQWESDMYVPPSVSFH